MSASKPRPDPADDEPVVDWEDFERASDLVVADQRPDQPREPVNSRHVSDRPSNISAASPIRSNT